MASAKPAEAPAANGTPAEKPEQQAQSISLEGDDTFEEFALQVREDAAATEEERNELWQADWDDEDATEDFQAKLRHELDRDMKE